MLKDIPQWKIDYEQIEPGCILIEKATGEKYVKLNHNNHITNLDFLDYLLKIKTGQIYNIGEFISGNQSFYNIFSTDLSKQHSFFDLWASDLEMT